MRASPRTMSRGYLSDVSCAGTYALGGGGSGDRATDWSSISRLAGPSLSKPRAEILTLADTITAFGEQDAI